MVLPGLGPANGCWLGEEQPVITICTDLRLPEASEAVKSEFEEPENQEIKDQSFSAVVLIHKVPIGCVSPQRKKVRKVKTESQNYSWDSWGQRPVTERNEVKTESQFYWGQRPVTEQNEVKTESCHGAK